MERLSVITLVFLLPALHPAFSACFHCFFLLIHALLVEWPEVPIKVGSPAFAFIFIGLLPSCLIAEHCSVPLQFSPIVCKALPHKWGWFWLNGCVTLRSDISCLEWCAEEGANLCGELQAFLVLLWIRCELCRIHSLITSACARGKHLHN